MRTVKVEIKLNLLSSLKKFNNRALFNIFKMLEKEIFGFRLGGI